MKLITAILSLLVPLAAMATVSESDRALVERNRNLLLNGGAEAGLATLAVSGGAKTLLSGASNVSSGNGAFRWDASASSQTACFPLTAIPNGWYGDNGLLMLRYKTTATDYQIVVTDGTNNLATPVILPANTRYQLATFNFGFPMSGSVKACILSQSNATAIDFDEAYLGLATNLTLVSQSSVYGTSFFSPTALCVWTVTDTIAGTWYDFPADTDCNNPTLTGAAQTPPSKTPSGYYTSVPPGIYEVIAQGYFSNSTEGAYTLTDGTSQSGYAVSEVRSNTLVGYFTYTTTQPIINWRPLASARIGGYTSSILNSGYNNSTYSISVKRFPLSSDLALQPSQVANSWSGYFDNNCSWGRTNTAFGDPIADSLCSFGENSNRNFGTVTPYLSGSDKLPGIVFTPKKTENVYWVCANPFTSATSTNTWELRLWDGTTTVAYASAIPSGSEFYNAQLCGIYVTTSLSPVTLSVQSRVSGGGTVTIGSSAISATINWSIFDLSSVGQLQIANQVQTPSVGGASIAWAKVNAVCSSSPCTLVDSSGVSSIVRSSTGEYQILFTTGTFSSAPSCSAFCGTGGGYRCRRLVAETSSSYTFHGDDSTGASADVFFDVTCVGHR